MPPKKAPAKPRKRAAPKKTISKKKLTVRQQAFEDARKYGVEAKPSMTTPEIRAMINAKRRRVVARNAAIGASAAIALTGGLVYGLIPKTRSLILKQLREKRLDSIPLAALNSKGLDENGLPVQTGMRVLKYQKSEQETANILTHLVLHDADFVKKAFDIGEISIRARLFLLWLAASVNVKQDLYSKEVDYMDRSQAVIGGYEATTVGILIDANGGSISNDLLREMRAQYSASQGNLIFGNAVVRSVIGQAWYEDGQEAKYVFKLKN